MSFEVYLLNSKSFEVFALNSLSFETFALNSVIVWKHLHGIR